MLCIFNPEHDLCLANGGSNYMAPASALLFADSCAKIMQILYPAADYCFSIRQLADSTNDMSAPIVPWGWNAVLKSQLKKLGVVPQWLPSDDTINTIRQLQHRTTLLPLQPQSRAAKEQKEVEEMIAQHHAVVLKAPWSGSGRGLRWVTGAMSPHDISWMEKVVRNQGCVIVEPRRQVLHDFALEYTAQGGELYFEGYSLFESANGVYQHNLLLPDEEIAARVGFAKQQQEVLESWLTEQIAPQYEGPLGVDVLHTDQGCFISEINLRHTMGLVACRYRQQHPEEMGQTWRMMNSD